VSTRTADAYHEARSGDMDDVRSDATQVPEHTDREGWGEQERGGGVKWQLEAQHAEHLQCRQQQSLTGSTRSVSRKNEALAFKPARQSPSTSQSVRMQPGAVHWLAQAATGSAQQLGPHLGARQDLPFFAPWRRRTVRVGLGLA